MNSHDIPRHFIFRYIKPLYCWICIAILAGMGNAQNETPVEAPVLEMQAAPPDSSTHKTVPPEYAGTGSLSKIKKVPSQPKIALVLSGGGARGLAQIGVLQAFEEAGVRPDVIVANSMGAIIGSLYAAGMTPHMIDSILKQFDWNDMFSNTAGRQNIPVSRKNEPVSHLFELRFAKDLTPILPNAVSHGQAIYTFLTPLLTIPLFQANLNFDSLPIPLRIVTTDILSGRSVTFSNGNLLEAVRASSGIPLAFSPVTIDTFLLLDGGVTANIPVEEAKKEHPDYIIAVDVTSPMWQKKDLDNPIHLFDQIVAISIDKQKKEQRKLADILISPDLDGIVNTDFSQPDTIIMRGYRAAQKQLPLVLQDLAALHEGQPPEPLVRETVPLPIDLHLQNIEPIPCIDSLVSALNSRASRIIEKDSLVALVYSCCSASHVDFPLLRVTPQDSSSTDVSLSGGTLREIKLEGNLQTSSRHIISASGLKTGAMLTQAMIDEALSALYATDLFHTVVITVSPAMTVHIKVVEKEYWRARFGMRFDEYHLLEGYIQPAYENLFGSAISASLHLQYGKMREKYAFELSSNKSWSPHLGNNFCFQGYVSRDRIIRDSTYIDTTDTTGNSFIIYYDEYTLRKMGVLARIGTQLGTIAMLDGTIRFEKFTVSRSNKGAFEDFPGPEFKSGVHYLMVRLVIDDLDRFPFPQKGQKHYISVGGASDKIGGTESFVNVHGSLQYYFTLREKHTLSPKFLFSWANKKLPPVEQVNIGGSVPEEKYRDASVYYYLPFVGLRPRALAGDITAIVNGSYRVSLLKNFYLITLVDWGYTWNEPDFSFTRETARFFLDNALLGIGLGIGINTVMGPIQLSWGRIINGPMESAFDLPKNNVLYFSAGHDF